MTLEQLEIRRSAVDGKLKRTNVRVNKLETAKVSVDDLNAELENLHVLWQDFREVHQAILDLCPE